KSLSLTTGFLFFLSIGILPSGNGASLEEFFRSSGYFGRLIGFDEVFDFVGIFIVVAGDDDIHVWGVFVFHEKPVFIGGKSDLRRKGIVDNRNGYVLVVEGTGKLWRL